MPKIQAPTVAEHNAMRRKAVTAAARDLLGSGGAAAVTPAAVAKRAGLARTSVYQYYPSTQALLGAAIESMFSLAAEQVRAAVADSHDPWRQVRAYITVALRAAAGDFGLFTGLRFADLPDAARAEVAERYRDLTAPLTTAITALDRPAADDADVTTQLVLGAVGAAIGMIRSGQDPHEVTEATLSFVERALRHDGQRPD